MSRDRSREWMLEAIERGRQRTPFDLWAYVVMPEHVHLVIRPWRTTRISAVLNCIKQSVSKRAIHWLQQHSPAYLTELEDVRPSGQRRIRFWQRGGGYDRNLRTVRDIHEKIRYVHENPVRRGLVERCEDWRWSSAEAWATGVDSPLAIDRSTVPPLTILDDRSSSTLIH